MKKTNTDNCIYLLLLELVFIILLVVEMILELMPEHLLGLSGFCNVLSRLENIIGLCWMLGSLPVGVIGIIWKSGIQFALVAEAQMAYSGLIFGIISCNALYYNEGMV